MFEKLFKFSWLGFTEGEVGLQAGPWLYGVLGLAAFLLVGFGVVYALTTLYTSNRDRAVSLGLRVPALLLLCLPLLEPVLVTPEVVPGESFVAVLVDRSASMTLPDGALTDTRGGDAQRLLAAADGGLLAALEGTFKLRHYTFARRAAPVDSLQQVAFDGEATDLGAALDRMVADFEGLPLAGVVLLTDGGHNGASVPLNAAEELRSLRIPLHVVGVGQEVFAHEREIVGVTTRQRVEVTTGAEISVQVRSWQPEPAPVTFSLYQGDDEVFSETRRLRGEGAIDQHTFFYAPEQEGARAYTLRVAEAQGELNAANNARRLLIDTRRDTARVLYFEGQVRPDFKFIKRALEDDPALEVASVLRAGTGRFYRQGIEGPDELRGGFPASEAALDEFEAVLFGDLEAAAFSPEQLQMIERFVRRRGGGFLMMGGRGAFAEGRYGSTPVADLLPARLDPSRRTVVPPSFLDPDSSEQGFRFVPTSAGHAHPILKLSPDPDTSRVRWQEMPRLTSINYLGAPKPGATVLAQKPEDGFGEAEPLLLVQRYGKGRSAALPTASTWQWQMNLPAEDARYERFWRQLVRWLAASAPQRVDLAASPPIAPGERLSLRVAIYDPEYRPLGGATVRGQLTTPSGATRALDFKQELSEAGVYSAATAPQEEGVYALRVSAQADGTPVGTDTRHILVRPSGQEFQNATLKRDFLERLARISGGLYYAPDEVDALPANLENRQSSASVYRTELLWDMPMLFGLVVLLLSAEWIWRRRNGLP